MTPGSACNSDLHLNDRRREFSAACIDIACCHDLAGRALLMPMRGQFRVTVRREDLAPFGAAGWRR